VCVCVCVCVCLFVGGVGEERTREIDEKFYSSDRKEWTSSAKEAKVVRGMQNPGSNKCCT